MHAKFYPVIHDVETVYAHTLTLQQTNGLSAVFYTYTQSPSKKMCTAVATNRGSSPGGCNNFLRVTKVYFQYEADRVSEGVYTIPPERKE